MQKNELLLDIENINKSYNKKTILNNITFKVYENEVLSFVGYSGVGKTTLLNIICGIENPDSGKINYYIGKKSFGYSSQIHSFYQELTIIENLEFFGNLYNIPKNNLYKRIDDLIEKFNLKNIENNLAYNLSEGQKKRLDIACSLINSPKILILDEPTANLDFKLRDELLKYVLKIKKEGVTIIFVSHILEDIEEVTTRSILLNNSNIKILESSNNLKEKLREFVKHGSK